MEDGKPSVLDNGALALDEAFPGGPGPLPAQPDERDPKAPLSLDLSPALATEDSPASVELPPLELDPTAYTHEECGRTPSADLELDPGPGLADTSALLPDTDAARTPPGVDSMPPAAASAMPEPATLDPGSRRRAAMATAHAEFERQQKRARIVHIFILLALAFAGWRAVRWISWHDAQLAAFDIAADRSLSDDAALERIADACAKPGESQASSATAGNLQVRYAQEMVQNGLNLDIVRKISRINLGQFIHCVAMAGQDRGLATMTVHQLLRSGPGTYEAQLTLSDVQAIPDWQRWRWTNKAQLYLEVFQRANATGVGYLNTQPVSARHPRR